MKITPFTHKHIALGAKMCGFAGYNMPISYTGINDEHLAVRNHAGIFDVSHMGEFIVKGPGALDLVQRVTSNDVSKLSEGQVQYSCLPNNSGGIVDDLLVYCLRKGEEYMLVVNASNIEKDWHWIRSHNRDVEMENISDMTGLLAVQGPQAAGIVQSLTSMDIRNLKYYHFTAGEFAGIENVLISATGYTGAGGVEIYFEDKDKAAATIWDAVMDAGKPHGLKPAGLAARDTLRLEMGFCLYGNDINDTTSPMEAGLGWITKFTKPFVGRDLIEHQKKMGTVKKLVGFEMLEKSIPRHGYSITDNAGAIIGEVTSGTQSPSLNKAIGMGYVPANSTQPGTTIFIKIRDRLCPANIVTIPFVKAE